MILHSGSILTFGSGAACEFRDPRLPPVAFQISLASAGVEFTNLAGSSVLLDGKVLSSQLLMPGERISCGPLSWLVVRSGNGWELQQEQSGVAEHGVSSRVVDHELAGILSAVADLASGSGWERVLAGIPALAARALGADAALLELQQPQDVRHSWPAESLLVSQTAIRKAMEQGEPTEWSQEDQGEESKDLSQSIVTGRLTAILVAPFRLPGDAHPAGYLYLQRAGERGAFGAEARTVMASLVRLCAGLAVRAREDTLQRERLQELRGLKESGGLVWGCEAMDKAVALAAKLGPLPVPVILRGETGTGKEVFARLVHGSGPRAAGPFVAVNCGAIPVGLMESVLFGHAKGAFTGAVDARKGVFEEAEGGTLFLDEIGELPLDMQVKLLRVLQERKVQRVGESREISVDVRIVSATHRDLEAAVKDGMFREDLYFRIHVMAIPLPPLRERGQDILLLAERFLARFAAEFGMPGGRLSSAASKALLRHGWPGNVRELENRIQKALVQCDDGSILPAHLGLDESGGNDGLRSLKDAREAAERTCVDRALRDAKGNLTLAGSILGIDRKVLRDLMERLGFSKDAYRQVDDE